MFPYPDRLVAIQINLEKSAIVITYPCLIPFNCYRICYISSYINFLYQCPGSHINQVQKSIATAKHGHALLAGRGYVTPQDVKSIAPDILRHRIIITYEAEAEEKTSDDIVRQILENVKVP